MHIRSIEAGVPIKILAGVHTGCFELIANDSVSSIADLKGKRVGVWRHRFSTRICLVEPAWPTMSGSIPASDIEWVESGPADAGLHRGRGRRLPRGHARAAEAARQEDRPHMVNNALDRPWSQYFCCMVAGNADYMDKYPVATKRVAPGDPQGRRPLRVQPDIGGAQLVDRGFLPNYDDALQR